MKPKPVIYHIPICPFSQRLEILLELKGKRDEVIFSVVDITRPYDEDLLKLIQGNPVLPVLVTPEGEVIRESLVLMEYLEAIFPEHAIMQKDPFRHAVENMLVRMEDPFVMQGYTYVMNQDIKQRDDMKEKLLQQYQSLNAFLLKYSANGPFLFEEFGWAEAVFTPIFMRFWFVDYYEDFELPNEERFSRVKQWCDACIKHPAAQQVSKEEIIKLYYDYARGAGNGSQLPGRKKSSFVFDPDWRSRPWPPKDKYQPAATDDELGL